MTNAGGDQPETDPAVAPVVPAAREMHGTHTHRDVQGGGARAAVFGISDGLVSNVALLLGMAGATSGQTVVRLAGLAGLVGGAMSMAAGEYNSMRVQTELFERELEIERREIAHRPEAEQRELAAIYRERGLDADAADHLSREMMRDPEIALDVHAREELGIDPASLGSPAQAALASFVAFAVGALVPLLPWFFLGGSGAVVLSLVLALLAAVTVGATTAAFTRRPLTRTIVRQVVLTVAPAVVTFVIGNAVGIAV